MNALAACREPNRSGKTGAYFIVLNHASEYGLSLETRGREWDLVTSRSASRVATVLLVIEVPRSGAARSGAGRGIHQAILADHSNSRHRIEPVLALRQADLL